VHKRELIPAHKSFTSAHAFPYSRTHTRTRICTRTRTRIRTCTCTRKCTRARARTCTRTRTRTRTCTCTHTRTRACTDECVHECIIHRGMTHSLSASLSLSTHTHAQACRTYTKSCSHQARASYRRTPCQQHNECLPLVPANFCGCVCNEREFEVSVMMTRNNVVIKFGFLCALSVYNDMWCVSITVHVFIFSILRVNVHCIPLHASRMEQVQASTTGAQLLTLPPAPTLFSSTS